MLAKKSIVNRKNFNNILLIVHLPEVDSVLLKVYNALMDNIVLIGMPASGKSTAGVLLAKTIGYGYIDCDLLIQNEQKALLCDIISRVGVQGFIEIEEKVNAELWAERCIISTGGSVIYGDRAMQHIKSIGKVVYIKVSLRELEKRLNGRDLFSRGVVMRKPGTTLAELYAERAPLYEKYADITVDCDNLTLDQTVDAIIKAVIL